MSRALALLFAATLCIASLLVPLATALSAPLIVNEFNAVSSGNYLNLGTATIDGDGNTSPNYAQDTHFGRIQGNGGDWIELVVVGDHLDIRGWMLEICEGATCNDQLVFSSDSLWSDLRAGSIITVAEDQATDTSYDPVGGDWWINVQATNGGPTTFISAENFPVNELDWNVSIYDDQGNRVFGPLGEHVPEDPAAGCLPPQDDVNAGEIFRLEQAPTALIDPCFTTQNDWEDGVISTFGAPNQWNSGTAVQDFSLLRTLAPFPDRDGDQIPDDGDFSGIAGDNPCVGGATAGCDDNCGGLQNAAQSDVGGPGGADGQGDGCQCGDPTGNDDVTADDVLELRELRLGLRSDLTVPERCSVYSDGECSLVDLVVLDRAVANPALEPRLAATCQLAQIPSDMSELLFDPDRVLEVNVRIAKADWDVLRFQENEIAATFGSPTCGNGPWNDPYLFYPADVTVDGRLIANSAVRKKGFQGSLSTTTPALKVKFDEYVGGQQINSMDRLTLNNNNQDPAKVKSCLSYHVLRKAGLPAPRCNFAHVTVTTIDGPTETTVVDEIYSNVESIKDPFLRRNFGNDNGRLFEGTLSDFWTGSFRNTFATKPPGAILDETELDSLTATLENNGLSDAARQAAIEAIVDLDDFLTYWAAEGVIGHWDGYSDDQNNFWFYIDDLNDGLMHFIPWGPDDTWGRGNFLRGNSGNATHSAAIVPRAALTRRLYQMPTTKALYLARLQDLMDNVYDEAEVHAEIDRIEALITPFTGSLTSELAPIRTWVDAHRAIVQAEIDSPPIWTASQPDHFCFFNP